MKIKLLTLFGLAAAGFAVYSLYRQNKAYQQFLNNMFGSYPDDINLLSFDEEDQD